MRRSQRSGVKSILCHCMGVWLYGRVRNSFQLCAIIISVWVLNPIQGPHRGWCINNKYQPYRFPASHSPFILNFWMRKERHLSIRTRVVITYFYVSNKSGCWLVAMSVSYDEIWNVTLPSWWQMLMSWFSWCLCGECGQCHGMPRTVQS